MKQLLCVLLCLPMLVTAQEKGIRFEEGLTWEQVVAKAKAENKFIFVDCYATWCQPCKMMDKEVYPDDKLGAYVNENFISVKVQMDSIKGDKEPVKLLRPAARLFEKEYAINSLPTYLFFSPEGRAVHKESGAKNLGQFKALTDDARIPAKQFYTQVDRWREGKMPMKELPALATKLKYTGNEVELAEKIAKDYKTNYLDKLNDQEFLKKENLFFVASFPSTVSLKDKVFDLFLHGSTKVDSVVKDTNFSKNTLGAIIRSNMIDPALAKAGKEGKEPDWKKLEGSVKKRLGSGQTEWIMNTARLNWYAVSQDDANRVKYLVKEVDRLGLTYFAAPTARWSLNNNAWQVFLHSTNKQELERALAWMDFILTKDKDSKEKDLIATYMDTKANILYKLNRKKEALDIEAQAYALLSTQEMAATLEKMRKGEPTWVVAK